MGSNVSLQASTGDVESDVLTAASANSGWWLTGNAGVATGCRGTLTDPNTFCSFNTIVADLVSAPHDATTTPASISLSLYFGIGTGAGATNAAVDDLVFGASADPLNNTYEFDFEPTGVYATPAS
jgi:hypothetical protein